MSLGELYRIYCALSVSPAKVIKMLEDVPVNNKAEQRVWATCISISLTSVMNSYVTCYALSLGVECALDLFQSCSMVWMDYLKGDL